MSLIELMVNNLLKDGATPVYTSLLGAFFRHEAGINWDTYSNCMEMCVALGSGGKEWFI